jgi:hypothetical protein
MRVKIEYSGKKNDPGDEYQSRCEVFVDDQCVAQGCNLSECPEDANLGRDLKFVYKLPEVLRAAHEAGQRGEPFELEESENVE